MSEISETELAEIAALVGGSPPPRGATAAELAGWLGLSSPRVNALAREGRIPRRADGRFDLQSAIRGYCDHLRTRTGSSALAQNPELNAEKIRIARASAEKLEMQNRRAAGELLAATDVEREWAAILTMLRAGVLALPSRIAQRLGHLTPHDLAQMDAEARDVLLELARDE